MLKLLHLACSVNCAAGCYMTGATKCDRCDFGYGLNGNGSCSGMLLFYMLQQSALLSLITDDTGKMSTPLKLILSLTTFSRVEFALIVGLLSRVVT